MTVFFVVLFLASFSLMCTYTVNDKSARIIFYYFDLPSILLINKLSSEG